MAQNLQYTLVYSWVQHKILTVSHHHHKKGSCLWMAKSGQHTLPSLPPIFTGRRDWIPEDCFFSWVTSLRPVLLLAISTQTAGISKLCQHNLKPNPTPDLACVSEWHAFQNRVSVPISNWRQNWLSMPDTTGFWHLTVAFDQTPWLLKVSKEEASPCLWIGLLLIVGETLTIQ